MQERKEGELFINDTFIKIYFTNEERRQICFSSIDRKPRICMPALSDMLPNRHIPDISGIAKMMTNFRTTGREAIVSLVVGSIGLRQIR